MTIIRPATLDDAKGIATVHVASWRSTYRGIVSDAFLDRLTVEGRERSWQRALDNPEGNYLLVAEDRDKGEITGFISGGRQRDPELDYDGEIFAIYLLESAQGRGTGRRLVAALAERMKKAGFKKMQVWVLSDNPYRKFYEALGGKHITEQTIQIGDDDLVEVAYGWEDINTLLALKRGE